MLCHHTIPYHPIAQETIQQFGDLLSSALVQPNVQAAATSLVLELCKDPEIARMVAQLSVTILSAPEVANVSGVP